MLFPVNATILKLFPKKSIFVALSAKSMVFIKSGEILIDFFSSALINAYWLSGLAELSPSNVVIKYMLIYFDVLVQASSFSSVDKARAFVSIWSKISFPLKLKIYKVDEAGDFPIT